MDSMRVYIRLQPIYIGNVRGLCGTYNFKTSDDWMPQNGFVENDLVSFVDAYKQDFACETHPPIKPCEIFIAVNN